MKEEEKDEPSGRQVNFSGKEELSPFVDRVKSRLKNRNVERGDTISELAPRF